MKLEHESDVSVAEVAQLVGGEPPHIDSVYEDLSSVGLVERADNLQERGLSGSRGSHDAHNLSFLDMQVDAS